MAELNDSMVLIYDLRELARVLLTSWLRGTREESKRWTYSIQILNNARPPIHPVQISNNARPSR